MVITTGRSTDTQAALTLLFLVCHISRLYPFCQEALAPPEFVFPEPSPLVHPQPLAILCVRDLSESDSRT
jgi:hypothetical protein